MKETPVKEKILFPIYMYLREYNHFNVQEMNLNADSVEVRWNECQINGFPQMNTVKEGGGR